MIRKKKNTQLVLVVGEMDSSEVDGKTLRQKRKGVP